MQNIAALVTLVLLIGLTCIFLKIVLSATESDIGTTRSSAKSYLLRSQIFWLLIVIGVAVTVFTLTPVEANLTGFAFFIAYGIMSLPSAAFLSKIG